MQYLTPDTCTRSLEWSNNSNYVTKRIDSEQRSYVEGYIRQLLRFVNDRNDAHSKAFEHMVGVDE